MFLALTILIGAVGYWVWTAQADSMKAQARQMVTAVAASEADEVSVWLGERLSDAEVISSDRWLGEAVARLDAGTAPTGTMAQVDRRFLALREAYGYAAIVLLAPDGAPLLSSPVGSSRAQGTRTALLASRAQRSGDIQTSDLYLDGEGRPRFEIAAPLKDARDDPSGVVILVSDPDEFLYPLLQDWPLPSTSGEMLLVERRGDHIVYLNDLRFREGAALRLIAPLSRDDRPAVMAVTGHSSSAEGVDYRGVPVFTAAARVPQTEWHVVAKLDRAEVLAPIRARGVFTGAVTALIVALTGTGILLFWRSREAQITAEILRGERRYGTLLDNLSAGVVVHAADTSIKFANTRACELLGLTLDQLTGRTAIDPFWRFLREDGSRMPVEEYPVQQVVASGGRLHNLVIGAVQEKEDADPVWALCNAFPQRGSEGEVTEIVVTFVDITARVIAERRLRTSERKFRETVESLDEGYFSTGLDGRFIDCNPALLRILGLPPDADLEGRTSTEFWWNPKDRLRWIERLRQTDTLLEYLADLRTEGGEHRAVVLSAHLIRNSAGEAVRLDGSATDITGLRRAQQEVERLNETLEQRVSERTEELDAANKELESFAYSVSHDLRAPLRHVSGFSTLLADHAGASLDEKSRHYVEVIIRSVNEMGVLIDDLLQFSRTGRTELRIEPVDMDAVVQEALTPLRDEMDGREIEWSIAPLPSVLADRVLIRQVWANLLGNAVKYTRGTSPSCIRIAGHIVDGEAVFSVSDNGVGFDMQYAHKLFGVFQRLHDASEFEGTGIGLANVHRIVTRLHGRVWAEGEPGNGATFSFSLPATREAT
jgi:PAS domain S-box-containing protein